MKDTATFAFVGDMIFDWRANAAAAAGRPERVWGDVLPVMRDVDAVFGNLENPITRSQRRWQRSFKPVCLKSDPDTVHLLKAANLAYVNIANNHTLDFEVEGLAETISLLDGVGIAHTGAGPDISAAAGSVLVDAGGITVGALSLTDNTPAYAAGPHHPGTHHVRIDDDPSTLARIAGEVRALRARGARAVVLSAHWGPNLRPWPPARFRRFARAVIDAGVDIFHGHSAHILQGVEMRGRGVILYDTGDFIDDTWWLAMVPHFTSALFVVDFTGGRVQGLRIVPVVLTPGRVDLARGALARRVISRLMRLSPPGLRAGDDADLSLHCRFLQAAGAPEPAEAYIRSASAPVEKSA